MKKKFKSIGAAIVALLLVLTGCPTTTPEDLDPGTDPVVASTPFIMVHPTSIDYLSTDTITPLTVEMKVASTGEVSYQWYENTSLSNQGGTEIAGATSAAYQPENKAEGFYYVKITNSGEGGTYTASSEPARIRTVASAPGPLSISLTVDTATTYQYVRAFGGALNVWSEPDVTPQEIEKLYNPDTGLGYNFLRICLYPYLDEVVNNTEIPELDRSDYFINVQRVNRYGGYVLASPWTPPAEMKDPPQRGGGSRLRSDMYDAYARHLKDFAQRMYNEGAPIYALSIQNEPDFVASYDGCEWTAEEQLNFFRQVGRFTEGVPGWGGGQATPYVKILPGEPANNAQKYLNLMQDEDVAGFIDIVGYHIYGNNGRRYTEAIEKGKETWMTEHLYTNQGNRAEDPTWAGVWSSLNNIYHVIAVNDSSAFNTWWIKRFYGLIGDDGKNNIEQGGVPDDRYPQPPDGVVTWRGYALSHFAKYAKETRRVKVDAAGISAWNKAVSPNGVISGTPGVHGTAYKTEDGKSISLVFWNQDNTDVGDLQINLPSDFTARSAWAIITTSSDPSAWTVGSDAERKLMERHPLTLLPGKHSAVLTLPKSSIISVKFVQ
jgi:O-glycosyl hydrolase